MCVCVGGGGAHDRRHNIFVTCTHVYTTWLSKVEMYVN